MRGGQGDHRRRIENYSKLDNKLDSLAASSRGQQCLNQVHQTQNRLVSHELFPSDVELGSICREEIDEVEAET